MEQKKLNDVAFCDEYGFFRTLFFGGNQNDFKWSKDLYTENPSMWSQLDGRFTDIISDDYNFNHASELLASPLVLEYFKNVTSSQTSVIEYKWQRLEKLMYIKYKTKWDKLWEVTKAQYNPIENYSMEENVTEKQATDVEELTSQGIDVVDTQNQSTDLTQTQKEKTDKTTSTSNKEDVTTERDIQGFNSTEYVPSEKTRTTRDDDDNVITERTQGDLDDNVVETHTQGSAVDNVTESRTQADADSNFVDKRTKGLADDNVKTIEHTRSGNIGVTTSQQMLESEIKLWQWNFIQDVVYKDLDSELALNIFSE